MHTIALLGASGQVGRLAARQLLARGHRAVLAGPDHDRLRALLDQLQGGTDRVQVRVADLQRPETLDAALEGVDLVISAAGPYEPRGRAGLEAALRHRVHYVDATFESPFLAWAQEQDARARAAGIVAVPAAGFPGVPLDLLAAVVAGAVTDRDALHLATTLLPRARSRAAMGPASRRASAGLLGQPVLAVVDGEPVEEPLAEARRLAWFPRPVGLAHAAAVPGTTPLTVPTHVADLRTVRQYVALPGWRAELLQLSGSVRRVPALQRRLEAMDALGDRGRSVPSERRRRELRWACVAETRGEEGVARAWANGRDLAATTAVGLVEVAETVLTGAGEPGVLAPGALGAPADLLDRLSARADLRWALIRP